MPADAGSAVFRAIADFLALRREAKRAKADLKDLGAETDRTSEKLGDAERKASRLSRTLTSVGGALQKVQSGWDRFNKSDAGKKFHAVAAAGERLGDTLHSIRNKIVVLSALAVTATAAIGPVMSLVGAVVSLSGAVGLVPGGLLAGAAAAGVLKIAFSGVDEVLKNLGERDAKKFAESIKDLPVPMQRVAKAAWEVYPAVDALKKSIQSAFWRGLEAPLKDLAGKYLPLVRTQGTTLAGTFNTMAKEFAGFLGQKSTVNDVNAALGDVNKMFKNLVGSVKPLGQVMVDVFKVSAEFLPGMGKDTASLTQRFADFIHTARESGKLKEWIQAGLDALKQLGQVLVNIARIFTAVFKAGQDSGNGFLQTLAKITDQFADFLHSAEGQQALKALFKAAADAAAVLMPVIKALAGAIAEIIPILVKVGEKLGPGVVALINGLKTAIKEAEPFFIALGEAVSDLLSAIGSAAPILGKFISGLVWAAAPLGWLADLIRLLVKVFNALPAPVQNSITMIVGIGAVALASLAAIGKLAGFVAGLGGTIGKGLSVLGKITGFGDDAAKAAPKIAKLKGAFTAVATGLRAMGAAALANPVILIIAAIAAIALLIILNWDTVKQWIAGFWAWLKATATDVWNWLTAVWNGIATGVSTAWTAILDFLNNIWLAIVTAIRTAAQAVWDFLTGAWEGIRAGTVAAWTAVTDAIKAAWDWIAGIVTGAAQAVWDFLTMVWNGIVTGVTTAWSAVTEAIRTAWNWITGIISSAVDGTIGLLGRIVDWLGGVFKGAWETAVSVVRAVCEGIAKAINAVVDAVRTAVNAIKDALSAIGHGISNAATAVGNAFQFLNPFSRGGLVGGRGNRDTTAIAATPGEYVMPVKAVKKYLPLLRMLNPYDHAAGASSAGLLADQVAGGDGVALRVAASGSLAGVPRPPASERAMVSGDVTVIQNVYNPLPEKPSETASKRIGQAARLGANAVLGGAA